MKISLHAQAELELAEGAAYYAREAGAEIASAFIFEFERSAKLLGEFPRQRLDCSTLRGGQKVGTQWRLYCLVHNIEKLARHGQQGSER